ncbi:MAG: stage II sporulation protein M [Clostridia bacterium]|nr:stage II sporulation protein M [Clostridia bacterium]
MRELLRQTLYNYLRPRLFLYVLVGVLYGLGVILGALGVGLLSKEQVDYLTQLITNFLAHLQNLQIDDQAYTREVLGSIWKDLGFIYLLSLTIIGLPGVFVIIFLRGFLLGFVLGFFAQEMAFDGMIFATLALVPQNLITVPVYLAAGVTAVELSWFLLRRFWHFPKPPLRPYVWKFTTFMFFLAVIASMGGLMEVYITPIFMKWVAAGIK